MKNNYSTVVGLDVHKSTIAVAVLPHQAERTKESLTIENHPKEIERLVKRIAVRGPAEFVYEAGPCGYHVQRQIEALGQICVVIAPGLTPVRPGDRVKTDKRDAEKLARLYRAGELTAIRIPTQEEESARDLVRVREDLLADRVRCRNRVLKFLLRQGRVYQEGTNWTLKHHRWLHAQRFEWMPLQLSFEAYVRSIEEADGQMEKINRQLEELCQKEPYRTWVAYLQCLKGIGALSALTLAVEAQEFRRFENARAFMSYTGMVPSEYSSGDKVMRGSITKVGNAHIRRVLVESAWNYRRNGMSSIDLAKRRKGCSPEIIAIANKAQDRLHRRFWRMTGRGKSNQVAVVAVARELVGFVWAIAQHFPTTVAV